MAYKFNTTHRHDYRWPNSTCLIPTAEPFDGRCTGVRGGDGTSMPWCGRDAPLPPPLPPLQQELANVPPVCTGMLSATDRPWCQKGVLTELITPRLPTSAPPLKVRPDNCHIENSASKTGPSGCCEGYRAPSSRPNVKKMEPSGCYEADKIQPTDKLGPITCSERNRAPERQFSGPKGCSGDDAQNYYNVNTLSQIKVSDQVDGNVRQGYSRNIKGQTQNCCGSYEPSGNPRIRPEGCFEEPQSASKSWCSNGKVSKESSTTLAARVGAAPQQDTSRFDQPNQYIQKLCDKYPMPTAVVSATPREEMMRNVYADRYRTTYQSDYCRTSDDTIRLNTGCDSYDPIKKCGAVSSPEIRNGGFGVESKDSVACKCGCGKMQSAPGGTMSRRIQSEGAVLKLRPPTCEPLPRVKHVHFSCCSPKSKNRQLEQDVGPPEKLAPWSSEYNDHIGKLGQMIIEHKMLYPPKKKQRG